MILAFEMTWTGTTHAPGNGATLETIALAWPHQEIRVFAEASHLNELRATPALAHLSFNPIVISALFQGRTQIVSVRRFLTEFAIIRNALARMPPEEPCLIMLLSATPTALLAASLASRLTRRRVGVQIGLHGNLNDINSWRTRNPILRRFDLRSAMTSTFHRNLRFLVLEENIKQELARSLPACAARVDVLPLPINVAELAVQDTMTMPATVQAPVRIGFVGLATESKGIDLFLHLAADFKTRFGALVEFTLVGRAMAGTDLSIFSPLADPVGTEHLSRADFLRRLAGIHYVMLPFRPGYYDLSASGGLIDAVTWLKPVIATRLPLVSTMFERYGDIGYLCADEAGLRTALEDILAAANGRALDARYAGQREAMRRARSSRTPDALAKQYRTLVEDGYPGLLRDVTMAPSRTDIGSKPDIAARSAMLNPAFSQELSQFQTPPQQ